jgi:LysR family transcriptional activator of nhaA
MQIKNLEEQVGDSLFLRNGKSISLTAKGRELLKTSSLFYDLRDEVTKLSEDEDSDSNETLRILVTNEVERPFVAEVVSKLAKRERKKLAILASTTDEALSKTVNNETDILLSHEKVDSSWSHVKVDFPVFLAISSRKAGVPAFDDPSKIEKILEYFGEDLIIPSTDTKLGQEFRNFSKKHKIKKDVVMETNIVSCLVRFVASGTGCAFLPLPYIKSSLYQNHIQLLGPHQGFWNHSIYIYANIPKPELEIHPLVKYIRNYGSL